MKALKKGPQTITIGKYLNLYKNKVIVPYENNRGTGKPAGKTVKAVTENLNPDALNSFPVITEDFKTFELLDAHSRTTGLLRREALGISSDRSVKIEVHVHHIKNKKEKIKLYEDLNNHKAHTGKDYLSNSDFYLGRTIKDIFMLAGIRSSKDSRMYHSGLNQLANVICAYTLEGSMTYPEVFHKKTMAKKICASQGKPLGFNLTPNKKEDIAAAVSNYKRFVSEFKALYPSENLMQADAKALLGSASLFGLLVSDYLAVDKSFMKLKPKRLADKFYQNIGRATPLVKHLTAGSSIDMTVNIKDLKALLKLKA